MKLSECLEYINKALNYPALTLSDIDIYFDMAFAELNTTLHIALPTLSTQIEEFKQILSKKETLKTVCTTDPRIDSSIPVVSGGAYYYDVNTELFYIKLSNNTYKSGKNLKGIFVDQGNPIYFSAIVYGDTPFWVTSEESNLEEYEISNYLCEDWIYLWLIPYVCYKYTIRDGGTGIAFSDEFSQGFQQLQETYNVPNKIILATVADKPAYTSIVEDYLTKNKSLNIEIPVRAITEDMKHARELNACFGSIFDRGGFYD